LEDEYVTKRELNKEIERINKRVDRLEDSIEQLSNKMDKQTSKIIADLTGIIQNNNKTIREISIRKGIIDGSISSGILLGVIIALKMAGYL